MIFFAGKSISEIHVKARGKSGLDGGLGRRVIQLDKREEFILHELLSWQP